MSNQERPGEFLGRAGVYVTVTGFCRCPKCRTKWDESDVAPDGLPNAERCPKGCNAEQFALFRPGFKDWHKPGGGLDKLTTMAAFLKRIGKKPKPTPPKKKQAKKPAKRKRRRP
jgi:hypothetical protein